MSVYKVLKRLYSLSQERDILPGEETTIEDPDLAATLLEKGAITPAECDWREEGDADVRGSGE
jgi:hypothetical protein